MKRTRNAFRLAALALGLVFGLIALAQKPDREGSDHPMFSRYPGARIKEHRQTEFAQVDLATGTENKTEPGKPTKKMFEGETTTIIYEVVGQQSALQVFRNYEQALSEPD